MMVENATYSSLISQLVKEELTHKYFIFVLKK